MSKTFPNNFHRHFLVALCSAATLSHLKQGSRYTPPSKKVVTLPRETVAKANLQLGATVSSAFLINLTQQKLLKSKDS